jgi:hypothetical protein
MMICTALPLGQSAAWQLNHSLSGSAVLTVALAWLSPWKGQRYGLAPYPDSTGSPS